MKRSLLKRNSIFTVASLVLSLFAFTPRADAATWTGGGTNWWDDVTSWDTGLVPGAGEDVHIINSGSSDVTVDYRNSLYPVLDVLWLLGDGTGTGAVILNQSQDVLYTYNEYIGYGGIGVFNQTGGGNSIIDDLWVGAASLSNGTYNLSGGWLQATNEYIGPHGPGEFNHTGGTNSAMSGLYVGAFSGSRGTYNQSGGSTVTYTLYLGKEFSSIGTYNLNGGTLGTTENIVNGAGTGMLNIDGGTLIVGGGSIDVDYFNVGNAPFSIGSFTLNSGQSLTAYSETIGNSGIGTFTQTGGMNTVSNILAIDLGVGTFHGGTYNLSGGTLNVQNAGGTGEIINNDTFNFSGGTLNADIITNNANFNLSGLGTRTVNGDFTNTGTVKVTDTTAVFTGTYTELGTLSTDPSDIYFTDLIVGDTGYLVGGAGDNFYISGDFFNNSTQGALWNTVDAYLGFTGAGLHDFYLEGWADPESYAWGTLELLDGGSLNLSGGLNADLYVDNLILGAGTTLDLGGFNLHYSGQFTDYGGTYYGGNIIVPEPSTMLLLGIGMVGLVGASARRKCKKKAVVNS